MSTLRKLMLTTLVALVASSVASAATTTTTTTPSKAPQTKTMRKHVLTHPKSTMPSEPMKRTEPAASKARSYEKTRNMPNVEKRTGREPAAKEVSREKKVYVHGYTRKDGTKVKGYWRTVPTKK